MKVFVVGYEPGENEAVSFFNWFYLEQDANDRELEYRRNQEKRPQAWSGVIYSGTVEIEGENMDEEEITELVDLFWTRMIGKTVLNNKIMNKYRNFIMGFLFGGFFIYIVSLVILTNEFGRMADLYKDNCETVMKGELN